MATTTAAKSKKKANPNIKPLTAQIDVELHRRVKACADRELRTLSATVTIALREYCDRIEKAHREAEEAGNR